MQPDDPKPVEVLSCHHAVNEPSHPPTGIVDRDIKPANEDSYADYSGFWVPETDIPYEDDGPWRDQPF